MLLGILFYQGYHYTFLIRYSVMLMLFFAFLNIEFSMKVMHPKHILIVLANLLLPIGIFFAVRPLGNELALACFTIAIAPTAAGAPVMATFLKTRVEFVTASVILTTPVIAIVLPFLLPLFIEVDQPINTMEVLVPTAQLVFIPLIFSQAIRRYVRPLMPYFQQFQMLPFYLFVFNIYLAASKASHFIRFEAQVSWTYLLSIALGASLSGLILFKVGEWFIGKQQFSVESGLALGRKNTMFALWVALSFINPLVGLGPIFYILFQNTYNSIQLYHLNKNNNKKPVS